MMQNSLTYGHRKLFAESARYFLQGFQGGVGPFGVFLPLVGLKRLGLTRVNLGSYLENGRTWCPAFFYVWSSPEKNVAMHMPHTLRVWACPSITLWQNTFSSVSPIR